MHILIYTRHWKIGGIERIIKNMVDGLGPLGYQFSIVTEDTPNPDDQLDLGPDTPIYFRDFAPFHEKSQQALRKLIQRINPDVAISMGSSRAIYKVPRALVDTPIPVIISEHNSPAHIQESLHGDFDFLTAIRNFADRVHVLVDDFMPLGKGNENFRVIGNPAEVSDALSDVSDRSDNDPRGNAILFVARLHLHQKQPDILVKAFALIADKHPSWNLQIYGEDWYGGRAVIESLISGYGLEDRIILNDHSSDVPSLMKEAQLLAFPSAFEGWGLVATEALSHGVPVIAFADCTGVNQIVRHGKNGLLVNGSMRSPELFATALSDLIENEDLRLKMSAAAPASVAQYSLEAFCAHWDDLLKETAALYGQNRLANLTDTERHYFEIVGSGAIFDKAAQKRKGIAAELAKLKRGSLYKRVKTRVKRELSPGGSRERLIHDSIAWIKRRLR